MLFYFLVLIESLWLYVFVKKYYVFIEFLFLGMIGNILLNENGDR